MSWKTRWADAEYLICLQGLKHNPIANGMRGNRSMTHLKHREICLELYSKCNSIYIILLFSCSVMSNYLQPHGLQHTRLLCPSQSPGAHSNSCSLSRWCHPTTLSSVVPFSSAFHLSQHQGLFQWVGSLHQLTKVLELQLQYQSFQCIFRTDFL